MKRRTLIPLVLAILLIPVGVMAQAVVLQSDLSAAAEPQMAAAPDGTVHLVYQGRAGQTGAIVHRAWVDDAWGPETLLSQGIGDQFDPAIAVAPDGTVHAAWSAEIDGRLALVHRMLRDGQWSPLAVIDTGEDQSEYPSIAARADGGVEIVWQRGDGVGFDVMHTSLDANGLASPPSVVADGFNLYPQIFLTPVPVVCWYEVIEGDFALSAAERIPGPHWRRIPLESLMLVNANRLPFLMRDEQGQWAALWSEREESRDRIILGLGGLPDYGAGAFVDDGTVAPCSAPTAILCGDGRWAVAWTGHTPSGPEIVLAIESDLGWEQVVISDGAAPWPTQVGLCESDGVIHAIWASDALAGGTGQLCHRTLDLN